MSLRSDILGWVIRRLQDIDAADPAVRAALFAALRREVTESGFAGAAAETALPHLDAAIARQEMHWLREGAGPPVADPSPAKTAPKPAPPRTKPWTWPSGLRLPPDPPGPVPPAPAGPYADHRYEFVTVDTPGGPAELNIGWTYDPACDLFATCDAIGFSFRTRAATFGQAAAHLAQVLSLGGLVLPQAFLQLEP